MRRRLRDALWKTSYFYEPLWWDHHWGDNYVRHYAEQWASVTEYFSLDIIKQMRASRLKRLLHHANLRVPAYSRHNKKFGVNPVVIHSEDDLPLLPIITKKDFKKYTAEGISCRVLDCPTSRMYANTTSGSTGEPFLYFLDTLYQNEKTALRYRYWKRAGVDINEPKIFCAPESSLFLVPNLIFLHPHFLRAQKERYVEIIRTSGAKVLFGFPLLVFDLLWVLAENNIDITFKRAILAGHAISPGIRSFFRQKFRCDTFEYYGTGETGSIAAECEVHQGLHIQEENLIVEIVDYYGKPLPDGTVGKILVTTLNNDVMPFIRYETGDRGVILSGACPCGRTSRRLLVDGRDSEYLLVGADGESISPSMLRRVLDPYFEHFHRYQVVQKDLRTLLILVIPTFRFRKVMEQEIANKVQKIIAAPMNITVKSVSSILPSSGGKFRCFVSDGWKQKFHDNLFVVEPLEKRC